MPCGCQKEKNKTVEQEVVERHIVDVKHFAGMLVTETIDYKQQPKNIGQKSGQPESR